MKAVHEALIEAELRNCVLNTIARLKSEDTHKPFHAALLPEQALFWSRFERSFSTSFGQRVIEQISKLAAESGGATRAETQRATQIEVPTSQLAAIDDHIAGLRDRRGSDAAGWSETLAALMSVPASTTKQDRRVISDLWWERDGINHYMSIKTVKPNLDQTAEAKRDLLKLKLAEPDARVYFGLYYNPYGETRSDYRWGFPRRIFKLDTDPCVLIGRDYWNTLGGTGFYDELLRIAERVGSETRPQIEALR